MEQTNQSHALSLCGAPFDREGRTTAAIAAGRNYKEDGFTIDEMIQHLNEKSKIIIMVSVILWLRKRLADNLTADLTVHHGMPSPVEERAYHQINI